MTLDDLLAFVLVLVRVGSVFAFLPFLGQGHAPRAMKAMVALAISLALFPVAGASAPPGSWQPIQFLLFAGAELTFGLLIGLGAAIIFTSLRIAGEMFGQQMGMALAHVADPVSGGQSSLLGTFCNVLGTLVFFAVGGHLMMLRALRHSFDCWPLGAFASAQFLRHMSVSAGAQAFVMAFQLAAPLLLLAFMVSLTMAVMARLVPQMNVLIVGFPLRIGVGLVGLTLFLPILVRYSAHVSRVLVEYMTGVVTGA